MPLLRGKSLRGSFEKELDLFRHLGRLLGPTGVAWSSQWHPGDFYNAPKSGPDGFFCHETSLCYHGKRFPQQLVTDVPTKMGICAGLCAFWKWFASDCLTLCSLACHIRDNRLFTEHA